MLQAMLVFSVAFTFWCIYAETHPPQAKESQKPSPVMVEMNEDNDFDDDPPTVVEIGRKKSHDVVVNYRIDLNWWNFISPSLRPHLLRVSQFFAWLATL